MDAYIILIILVVCMAVFAVGVFLCRKFKCLGTETKTVEKYEYSSQCGTLPCTMPLPQQTITQSFTMETKTESPGTPPLGLGNNLQDTPPSIHITQRSLDTIANPVPPPYSPSDSQQVRCESPLLPPTYSLETENERSPRPPRPPKPDKFTSAYYRQGFYKSSAV